MGHFQARRPSYRIHPGSRKVVGGKAMDIFHIYIYTMGEDKSELDTWTSKTSDTDVTSTLKRLSLLRANGYLGSRWDLAHLLHFIKIKGTAPSR